MEFHEHLTTNRPLMSKIQLEKFNFRNLHPKILIGTASDRYAGWVNQIYSQDRYKGRITKRIKIIAQRSFTEEVLPVDSVAEYLEHFPDLHRRITLSAHLPASLWVAA